MIVERSTPLISLGIMEGSKTKAVMKGMNSVDCMDMHETCALAAGDDGEAWKDENGKIAMEFPCPSFNHEHMSITMTINSDA